MTIALVCGVAASLALGVVLAYWVWIAMVGLFGIHARHAAAARVAASASAEGGGRLRVVRN